MQPRLLLFDIDGTLLRVQSGFTRSLIEDVLQTHQLDSRHLNEISFAGRTDRYIFTEIIHKALGSVDEVRFTTLKQAYIQSIEQKLRPEHVEVLPGAYEVLSFCKERKIVTGILSGNFRESAHTKLSQAGLVQYFSFGAYGSLHVNRDHLPELALKAAETACKRSFSPKDCWVIGDTPYDITCAHSAGMRAVALPTGPYSLEKLLSHKPDLLLPSLNHLIQYLDGPAD